MELSPQPVNFAEETTKQLELKETPNSAQNVNIQDILPIDVKEFYEVCIYVQ